MRVYTAGCIKHVCTQLCVSCPSPYERSRVATSAPQQASHGASSRLVCISSTAGYTRNCLNLHLAMSTWSTQLPSGRPRQCSVGAVFSRPPQQSTSCLYCLHVLMATADALSLWTCLLHSKQRWCPCRCPVHTHTRSISVRSSRCPAHLLQPLCGCTWVGVVQAPYSTSAVTCLQCGTAWACACSVAQHGHVPAVWHSMGMCLQHEPRMTPALQAGCMLSAALRSVLPDGPAQLTLLQASPPQDCSDTTSDVSRLMNHPHCCGAGALHTHRGAGAHVAALCSAWQWGPGDRILHTLPLHHIHGIVNALYCAHAAGACVEFLPRFSPGEVWRCLEVGLGSCSCAGLGFRCDSSNRVCGPGQRLTHHDHIAPAQPPCLHVEPCSTDIWRPPSVLRSLAGIIQECLEGAMILLHCTGSSIAQLVRSRHRQKNSQCTSRA